jgi:hypothetical protein
MHGLGSPRASLAGDQRTSLRGFVAPRYYSTPHFLTLSINVGARSLQGLRTHHAGAQQDRLAAAPVAADRGLSPYIATADVIEAITLAALSKAPSRSVMPWRRAR